MLARLCELGVGPARNALKLVRGKFNNLIHNSMIMLTQRTMHGRRVFDVGRSSSLNALPLLRELILGLEGNPL